MIGILAGVAFFALNTMHTVVDKAKEKKKLSFPMMVIKGVVFLLPFFILSFYFVPIYHDSKGTGLELYIYHDYPCENKTFTTKEKMVILKQYGGMLPHSAYYLTRFELEDYKEEYVDNYYKHQHTTYIEKGKEFKIVGYYRPIAPHSGDSPYYLAEILDNKKTKVWIGAHSFNSKQCYPEDDYDTKHFIAQRGTYSEDKIDLSKLTILP